MSNYTITANKSADTKFWETAPQSVTISELRVLLEKPQSQESKGGSCFLPGVIQGKQRVATAVDRIDMLVYDVDGHQSMREAYDKLREAGVYAIMYTTYSHLTSETLILTDHFYDWLKKEGIPEKDAATRENVLKYLAKKKKGHLTNVVYDVSTPESAANHVVKNAKGLHLRVLHDPLEKFRIVLPLASPIPVGTLSYTTKQSIAEYKSIYHGVGQALGLQYDPACEDPSRVHFLPSCHPSRESQYDVWETGDAENPVLLDWTKYPRAQSPSEKPKTTTIPKNAFIAKDKNGTPIDLLHWEQDNKDFDIEGCLEANLPPDEIKDARSRGGFHITCPHEADHSSTGGLGTFCCNADESFGWTIKCSHSGCSGRTRIDHIRALVECGTLDAEDLAYEAPPPQPSPIDGDDNDDEAALAATKTCIESVALLAGAGKLDVQADGSVLVYKSKDGPPRLLCSPLIIDGVGYTADHKNPALLLRVRTETGQWTRLVLKRAELVNGGALKAKLRGAGIRTADDDGLCKVLSVVEPARKVITAEQPGWSGDAFALPDGSVIGSTDVVPVYDAIKGFDIGGSRDEADKMLSAIEHQSRIVFAMTASLAAPLYSRHGIEPGGINLAGKSSGGKTTTLAAALSVWGKGDLESRGGLIGSANTTSFAAEVRAAAVNNLIMVADEIKTAAPETVESLLYTIPNGASRAAGRADGGLREQRQFSVMLLMTGEMSAREYLESNQIAYNAGMAVRIIDIPADAGAGRGIFDVVPDVFRVPVNSPTGSSCTRARTTVTTVGRCWSPTSVMLRAGQPSWLRCHRRSRTPLTWLRE